MVWLDSLKKFIPVTLVKYSFTLSEKISEISEERMAPNYIKSEYNPICKFLLFLRIAVFRWSLTYCLDFFLEEEKI